MSYLSSTSGDFPSYSNLCDTVRRIRAANSGAFPNPTPLDSMVIPEHYKKTKNCDIFLLQHAHQVIFICPERLDVVPNPTLNIHNLLYIL